MEAILTLVGFFIVGSWIWSFLSGVGNAVGDVKREREIRRELSKFEVRVKPDTVQVESGEALDVVRVEVKGGVPTSSAGFGLISLVDGAGDPIQCLVPQDQEPDTLSYLHLIKDDEGVFAFIPGHGTLDWATLAIVPKLFLLPKNSGPVRLKATLRIFCPGSGHAEEYVRPEIRNARHVGGDSPARTIESAYALVNFPAGYSEIEDERTDAISASAVIAVLMSAADGQIEEGELEVLKTQLGRRAGSFSDPAAFKGRTSAAVQSALRELENGASPESLLGEALSIVVKYENEALCIETVDLCLEVLASDGVVDEREAKFLRDIGRQLGVESGIVSDMLVKRVAVESLVFDQTDSADFSVLGVDSSMEPAEIRKVLNAAFRKWNGLVHHDDPDIAEKARSMLDLIGDARDALLDRSAV